MFGKRLRELRLNKSLTQEQLGKIIGKSKNNISQYETGKREPDLETLNKFAEIFNVKVDYLLGNKKTKKEKISEEIIKMFAESEGINLDSELSDRQRDRLLNIVKKAIEISKLK
ncbi:MAG: helix-turn-helix transcriptional regulator [Firmicutes bacterium]|nr:helix-turn-helix transcriptional regulator [Bacillota bacterium]